MYPSARAVLEATALLGWTLDPGLTPNDRALRAAEAMLWSEVATRRPEAGWSKRIIDAGFDVRAPRTRPGEYFVWTGEGSRSLSIGRLIRTVHGEMGSDLYNKWSAASHPDPLALAERATMRHGESGFHVGTLIREDHDVEVAAQIADLVADAIICQAGYFGRRTGPADVCRAVARELREALPIVAEQVRIRNASA